MPSRVTVPEVGVAPPKSTVTPVTESKDKLAPARSGGAFKVGCKVQLLPSQVHVSPNATEAEQDASTHAKPPKRTTWPVFAL